jgi:CMP-N-acetylneuraminic acid synthetase
MAFADPLSITIDGTANSLARTFVKNGAGQFVTADGSYSLEVAPNQGASSKVRTARLRNSKVTSDPLVTTTNVRVTDLISLNVTRPLDGYTDAEVVKQLVGFFAFFTANTNANLIKFVAGEN